MITTIKLLLFKMSRGGGVLIKQKRFYSRKKSYLCFVIMV